MKKEITSRVRKSALIRFYIIYYIRSYYWTCESINYWQATANGEKPRDDESSSNNNKETRWREILAVIAINMVTLLQGASLSTSSISTVQLMLKMSAQNNSNSSSNNNNTLLNESWPRDFSVTDNDIWLIRNNSGCRIIETPLVLIASLVPIPSHSIKRLALLTGVHWNNILCPHLVYAHSNHVITTPD